jgi:hypothetical protein
MKGLFASAPSVPSASSAAMTAARWLSSRGCTCWSRRRLARPRMVIIVVDTADGVLTVLTVFSACPQARDAGGRRMRGGFWASQCTPSKGRGCCTRRHCPSRELHSAIVSRTRVGPSIDRVGARVNARRLWCAVGGAGTWDDSACVRSYRRGFVRAASALRTVVGSLAITRK